MLSSIDLQTLLIAAQKDSSFGDGTTRVDSGHLSIIIEELTALRELVRYQNDLAKDARQTEFGFN